MNFNYVDRSWKVKFAVFSIFFIGLLYWFGAIVNVISVLYLFVRIISININSNLASISPNNVISLLIGCILEFILSFGFFILAFRVYSYSTHWVKKGIIYAMLLLLLDIFLLTPSQYVLGNLMGLKPDLSQYILGNAIILLIFGSLLLASYLLVKSIKTPFLDLKPKLNTKQTIFLIVFPIIPLVITIVLLMITLAYNFDTDYGYTNARASIPFRIYQVNQIPNNLNVITRYNCQNNNRCTIILGDKKRLDPSEYKDINIIKIDQFSKDDLELLNFYNNLDKNVPDNVIVLDNSKTSEGHIFKNTNGSKILLFQSYDDTYITILWYGDKISDENVILIAKSLKY